MNKTQHESLKQPRFLHVSELVDQSDRTLLYGYLTNRDTFHVYLKGGTFHTLIYGYPDTEVFYGSGTSISLAFEFVVPNKRLYPEACDFEYCRLLQSRGVHLPFTTFNEERRVKQYHGLLQGEKTEEPKNISH